MILSKSSRLLNKIPRQRSGLRFYSASLERFQKPQDEPVIVSPISYTRRRRSEIFGQLVDSDEPSKKVNVIDADQLENEIAEIRNSEPDEGLERISSQDSRLHPLTIQGRVNRTEIKLNEEVSETINNHILLLNNPRHLRMKASQTFVDLGTNGTHKPVQSELEADAHIAGLFVQNYASIYQVLSELKKRVGESFNPQRVLDVGFGPATGMVALNELMGSDFNPTVKDAVVVGSYEMKQKAKIILSRQLAEYTAEAQDEFELHNEPGSSEPVEAELKRRVARIDTKRITIKTNLLSSLPIGNSKEYDLIILNHQLLLNKASYPAQVEESMDAYLQKLAPGGHLVIVERGTPLGFETIAKARQVAIRPENHSSNLKIPRPYQKGNFKTDQQLQDDADLEPELKEHFEIIDQANSTVRDYYLKVVAPCAHHGVCPLQTLNPDVYSLPKYGKKLNFCHFQTQVLRPKFSMELKKGLLLATKWTDKTSGIGIKGQAPAGNGRRNGRNNELASFSYLILERSSSDAPTLSKLARLQESTKNRTNILGYEGDSIDNWPRVMKNPLKRKGLILAEMCGPSGLIEKWYLSKGSGGKQIYHDARKLQAGDLWAIGGAKSAIPANTSYDHFREKIEKKQSDMKVANRQQSRQELKLRKQTARNALQEAPKSLEESLYQLSVAHSMELEKKPKERRQFKKY
ncbi:hypothetical protein LJB42_000861 [Komagataella kurtzmanii]|nr:hypothetical protein LJB42_000861 [Komagataella kurtzmanii]